MNSPPTTSTTGPAHVAANPPSKNDSVLQMAASVSNAAVQEAPSAAMPSQELLASFVQKPEKGTLWWNADNMAEAKGWEADLLKRGADKVEMRADPGSERVRVFISLDRARANEIMGYPVEDEEWLIPEDRPREVPAPNGNQRAIALYQAVSKHYNEHDTGSGSTFGTWKFNVAGNNTAEATRTSARAYELDSGGIIGHTSHELAVSDHQQAAVAHEATAKEMEGDLALAPFASSHRAFAAEHRAIADEHQKILDEREPRVTEQPAAMSHQVGAGGRELITFLTLRATLEPETPISNRYKAAVGFHSDPIDPISFPNRAKAEAWVLSAIREELSTHLEDQGFGPDEERQMVELRKCETIEEAASMLNGLVIKSPPVQMGQLALEWSEMELPLQVLQSGGGYYLGTFSDEEGPVSRESQEYFRTWEDAEAALKSGAWTQRDHP